jgi:hypothetical protein
MKKIIFLFITTFMFLTVKSQEVNDFVNVFLKNGYTMKGILVEKITNLNNPNSFIKLKLKNEEIIEVNYNQISKIELNEEESKKLKQLQEEKVLKKLQEEKLKKENEERDKQIILNENQRKENIEKRSSELKNITSNDYFFIGYGLGQSMWGKGFENLANSYKLIVPIEHSNNVTFKSYDIFVEYVRNFSDKKNIFINLNFKNYTTTFLSNELNLNFISNSYALNFGYNFYQNRFFQSGVGSGLIYTQSNVATDIDNRTNVLCGKTDFYSIPIFLNLRSAFLLSKIPAFIYIKPAFNINLLSTNSTNNYCITAGLGIFLKK